MSRYNIKFLFLTLLISMFLGCVRQSYRTKRFSVEQEKQKTKYVQENKHSELAFVVKNISNKTLYVTCFSYIKKKMLEHWRWDKSEIYKIEPNEDTMINIDTITIKYDRESIYGSLAIFEDEEEATNSTYELLKEQNRIDLPRLYKLKNNIVQIGTEKYGFHGDIFYLDIDREKPIVSKAISLNFDVENQTSNNLYICCFLYQRKNDMPIWQFDKTDVKLLPNNEKITININKFKNELVRKDIIAYLGVFNENNSEEAEKATYELLKPENKFALGELTKIKNKTVNLEKEKYGQSGTFIDFSIK